MADVKVVEGSFQVDDGVSLFTKSWLPADGPLRAKMIMVHGFNDHVDRYYDFFPSLARRGIAVHAFDQRGWGRSVKTPADRGRSGATPAVLADIAAFLRSHLPPEKEDGERAAEGAGGAGGADVPVFVLGHSMGGGEVLALASTPQYADLIARVRGWILEAPFLGFTPAAQPSWLTIASGRLAAHVVPHFRLVRPIPPAHLCRDPAVQASLAADTLLHETGTLEGHAAMIGRAEDLTGGRLRPLRPQVRSLLVAHGTADAIASFERVRAWADEARRPSRGPDALEDLVFKAYEGWFHQLHAEPGREEFYKDVGDWILERSGGGEGLPPAAPEAKL
ncbi:alpha/beta-hydrolase [Durotheca rogersii]|uniref:alpha/beta-hydrolase n=1 Tax=Durotheca rogersii TaxID=419775 RepID=UPI00221EE09D|nr:alpha/beta-hydrolase [Durotheca rogersii]KAI5867131.1 alpha/beta-hydrolase [Durotheca rogersii]